MRTASDSIKSIFGMELNITEITRNNAAEANRKKGVLEKECAFIEKRHAFIASDRQEQTRNNDSLTGTTLKYTVSLIKLIQGKKSLEKYKSRELESSDENNKIPFCDRRLRLINRTTQTSKFCFY